MTSPVERRRGVIGPFTARQILAVVAVLAGAGLLLAVLTTPIGGTPPAGSLPSLRAGGSVFDVLPPTQGLAPGQKAPPLAGIADGQPVELKDLDGRPIRLEDYRGHPVWINFWASWCPPCQQETPLLRSVYETHRAQGLVVIGVSVQETSPEDVRRYASTYGLDYIMGFDVSSAVFKAYQAYGLPTQVFLDGDGTVRAFVRGRLAEVEVERILAPLLASAAAN